MVKIERRGNVKEIKKRLFVAVGLSPEVRQSTAGIIGKLKKEKNAIKWVEPSNLHLTLKFLGGVEKRKVRDVEAALEAARKAVAIGAFEVSFKGLGAFPRFSHPRVFWIGIDKGKEELAKLAQAVEEKLVKIGFEKESRPFTAHLTIGRVRSGVPRFQNDLKEEQAREFGEMRVESFELIQSFLSSAGARYETLRVFKLA